MRFVIETRGGVDVIDWGKCGGHGCRPATDAESQLWRRLEVAQRMAEALAPMARFVFGPNWVGHVALKHDGDVGVLWGYDEAGNETGVNVMHSDFVRAAAALAEWENTK